jgi:hypothetical protein
MIKEGSNYGEISNWRNTMDPQSRNAKIKIILTAIGFVLLVSIILTAVSGCSYFGKSDYEKGANYLKDKKFTEALYEFQKVDPENKNFGNAQSKINYINGLLAFNDGRKTEAAIFLAKVKNDDEYYHDAQLMLQKINEASVGNDLQSQLDELKDRKDTVIIKREVERNPKKVKNPIDPVNNADREISKKYVSDVGSTISRFESTYQSAKSAPLSSKSDLSKSMESLHKEFNFLKYTAQNKDGGVVELARLTGEWMNKRISFIRQLITERSVDETANSRPLREEGDRLYSAMISQLNKVKKSI